MFRSRMGEEVGVLLKSFGGKGASLALDKMDEDITSK